MYLETILLGEKFIIDEKKTKMSPFCNLREICMSLL